MNKDNLDFKSYEKKKPIRYTIIIIILVLSLILVTTFMSYYIRDGKKRYQEKQIEIDEKKKKKAKKLKKPKKLKN